MTGPRAPIPADPADHPLRAALARGDASFARSGPALGHLLAAHDRALTSEAVVAQVRGMIADLARQLAEAGGGDAAHEPLILSLLESEDLRAHCQALALEWRLALRLEGELALDPVLSPILQSLVAHGDPAIGGVAMAALAAQARFAQGQRRMQLPLGELPAELFHAALLAVRGNGASDQGESRLRSAYDEADGRLALLARLADAAGAALALEDAGVALWLSALAARSGQSRERTACAAVDPALGRLLLTLRAAGVSSADAERQALRAQPDAELPPGLGDIGTREAAQWLAEARA